MKRALLSLIPSLLAAGCAGSANEASAPPSGIIVTLEEEGRFDTFLDLLRLSGVVDELSGEGPFTVFAPDDEAFAAIEPELMKRGRQKKNRAKLQTLLRFHVVPQRLPGSVLVEVSQLQTLAGQPIEVSRAADRLLVGTAVVEDRNVMAPNGIIHVLDDIIRPPTEFFAAQEAEAAGPGIKGGPDSWWW